MPDAIPTAPTEAPAAPAPSEAAPAAPVESTVAPVSFEKPSGDSTTGSESATHESSPSLLSSANQPAPAAEAKPDAKSPDTPVANLAEQADKKAEVKADAATDPATTEATALAPPAPVSLEDLKLPEGTKLDAEAGKAFVDLVNNGELARKDLSQGLFDLHTKEISRVADEMAKHQRKVWDDTNAKWKDDTRKEFGNRLDTALAGGKAMIEEFGGDRASRILQFLDYTGAGNHPDVIWLFDQLAQKFNVFENSIVASNPKAPSAKGPGNRGWYDNSLNK